jgi:hypothetical protein
MSTLPQNPSVLPTQESPRQAGQNGAKVLRFRPATKKAAKLRLALIGGSKSGKTYTALRIAQALVPGGRVALIDTEHGTASKYAGYAGQPGDEHPPFAFDALDLETFHPNDYIRAIRDAEAAGYDALIIDSFSHEWIGKDGALELVDRAAKKYQGNSYVAWGDVTPLHREVIETILKSPLHIVVTMRAKTEYVLESRNGKQVPRKIGIAPIQRDGIEYEFDVAGELNQDHELEITSSRCPALDAKVFKRAGADVAQILRGWLSSDVAAPPAAPAATAPVSSPAAPLVIPAGMSEAEAKVVHSIGPSVAAATTEEDVEALRKLAREMLPADAKGKTIAGDAYQAWHKATFGAAFMRVGGGAR